MFVYQLVEEAALKYKTSIALICEGQSVTYKQLLKKVTQLSNAILQQAPGEQFIGISASCSIEMIAGVLAILKSGKTYLPLDPKYPPLRLQQLIEDSGLKYTLSVSAEKDFFNELSLEVIPSDQEYHFPDIAVPFHSPIVCVLYTSGSTGKPKGVCLGHPGLINQINWQKKNGIAKHGTKTLQYCHLSFDAAFQEIFVPLSTGGTLYLINDHYRLNTGNLLQFVHTNAINRLFLPYAIVHLMSETAQIYDLFPPSLREIITGGELLRITPQISNFFNELPDCILMNVYGPTETSIWVTELKLKGNALEWPAIPSIGTPAVGASLFIVDENLGLLPTGQVGEIFIHGECLALYYLNKPEQTAERFIQWHHPVLGNIRVYRTGDLALFNTDGSLQFQGRKDEQVKIRGGNRVEPGEIEVVISQIPGIKQALVMVREDIPGNKTLAAYIVLSDTALKSEDIRHRVAELLPSYMIPSSFVFLDAFPYTVSGKIDKKLLPSPEKQIKERTNTFKEVSNENEAYLKNLWEELLQLENISANDHFFELGGNSLMVIQMIVRIEKEKGIQLPLDSLFDSPTIEKLAPLLLSNTKIPSFSPLVAIKASGNRPPVYLVHGDSLTVLNFSGIAMNIHTEQPVYGLQPKGLDGISQPLETIESIARYYNKAILKQNPEGPYAIAGYSFGGYVAIEMAKQLQQKGKKVVLLGMLDTNVTNAENFLSRQQKIIIKIRRQYPKLKWLVRSIIQNPKKAIKYQLIGLNNRIRNLLQLKDKPAYEDIEPYTILMNKINRKHYKALHKYRLENYSGKIVLFKALERPYFVDDFEYLGWLKYAEEGVDVYSIPGDHKTMFLDSNSKLLAEAIETALLKAIN
jgi:amino acid adenylation domain-containing protein